MTKRLLHPWRSKRLWPALVNAVLDLPLGVLIGVPTFVLSVLTVALAIVLPVALVPLAGVLTWTRLMGKVERSRAGALLQLPLADPVLPLPDGSRWAKLKAIVVGRARWKQVGYCLLRLPLSLATFTVVVATWSGSVALAGLPLFVQHLPGGTAELGLFDVSQGPLAVGLALLGLVGLVLVAPWLTLAAAWVDSQVVRLLLGPPAGQELAIRAERAETGRSAAVDAAEAERRRIERDLHDGAQQRLVALAVDLGSARERFDTDPEGARRLVVEAHEEAKAALREIRDLVRGIYPAILADRGLDASLSAVVARSPVPVELDVQLDTRLPDAVESTAYFVVSEALTNVARHARATRAYVTVARAGDRLIVEVRDDGGGGADPAEGTGLQGLLDRVVGMGGTLDLLSPPGGPTTVLVELPCAS